MDKFTTFVNTIKNSNTSRNRIKEERNQKPPFSFLSNGRTGNFSLDKTSSSIVSPFGFVKPTGFFELDQRQSTETPTNDLQETTTDSELKSVEQADPRSSQGVPLEFEVKKLRSVRFKEEERKSVLELISIEGDGTCFVCQARCSYCPQSTTEKVLPFTGGDFVLIWKSNPMDPTGFYNGELLSGQSGLVPSNLVDNFDNFFTKKDPLL